MIGTEAAALAIGWAGLAGADLQLGYVVKDIEAAMTTWTRDLRVGPFLHIDAMGPLEALHDGQPAPVVMSCAFSYVGNVQIELIEQRNEVPSLYREFLDDGREGFQHVGVLVDDCDAAEASLRAAGGRERLRIAFGPGSRDAVYVDLPAPLGMTIELIEASPARRQRNAYMRDLAMRWDGKNPVIRFASMGDIFAAAGVR